MGKRTLTGAVILIVTALFVASRFLSVYFFDAFIMAISFIACYEVLKAHQKDERRGSKAYIYLSVVHAFLLYLTYVPFVSKTILQTLLYQLFLAILFFVASMITDVVYLNKHKDEEFTADEMLLSTKKLMTTILWPNTLIGTLYGINGFSVGMGTMILGLVFGVAMATDVFAYLVGSAFHRGNFANQISPKKSLSGAIGGLFGGIIISVALYLIFVIGGVYNPFTEVNNTSLILFFVLVGLLGSIATEAGDLVASSVKRRFEIKDFGKILPGHGGVMDRIDGMMFVSAITYILALIIIV